MFFQKEEEREQQRLKDEAEKRMKKAKELKRIQEAEEAARKAAAEQKRLRQQGSASAAGTVREKENFHHKPPIESRKGVVYLILKGKLLYSKLKTELGGHKIEKHMHL